MSPLPSHTLAKWSHSILVYYYIFFPVPPPIKSFFDPLQINYISDPSLPLAAALAYYLPFTITLDAQLYIITLTQVSELTMWASGIHDVLAR